MSRVISKRIVMDHAASRSELATYALDYMAKDAAELGTSRSMLASEQRAVSVSDALTDLMPSFRGLSEERQQALVQSVLQDVEVREVFESEASRSLEGARRNLSRRPTFESDPGNSWDNSVGIAEAAVRTNGMD